MSVLKESQKKFKITAGILGVIESLAYLALSSLCIILYLSKELSLSSATYMGWLQTLLYYNFLKDNTTLHVIHTLTPDNFHILSWFYAIINFLWLIVSTIILIRNKQKFLKLSLQIWCYMTWIICLLDLITVIILGADYDYCQSHHKVSPSVYPFSELICADGILPVLAIAAKGFVLWIINLILAIIIYKISRNVLQMPSPSQNISRQPSFRNMLNPVSQTNEQHFGNSDRLERNISNDPYANPLVIIDRDRHPPVQRKWFAYSSKHNRPNVSPHFPSHSNWRANRNDFPTREAFKLDPPPLKRYKS